MSGKINGNGGLGEIFKRILAANNAPAEASPATPETGRSATMGGDVNLIGTGGAARLARAASPAAVPASPSDLVRGASDLNDLIGSLTKAEFPGLKLNPMQAAGLATFLRDQLAQRGMTDEQFAQLKDQLGR
ncbi:hypothetical protein D3C86_1406540 [compost metagenome]